MQMRTNVQHVTCPHKWFETSDEKHPMRFRRQAFVNITEQEVVVAFFYLPRIILTPDQGN